MLFLAEWRSTAVTVLRVEMLRAYRQSWKMGSSQQLPHKIVKHARTCEQRLRFRPLADEFLLSAPNKRGKASAVEGIS